MRRPPLAVTLALGVMAVALAAAPSAQAQTPCSVAPVPASSHFTRDRPKNA